MGLKTINLKIFNNKGQTIFTKEANLQILINISRIAKKIPKKEAVQP